ncbi:hypothetical protein [Enhygromyxa salina]|uniref:hypothetical protein n=1 Tax=Enhygromyxa salina TaxID=215803 RepID=UPI0015E65601|nr:hypothetical protein [Enhygromyxa salina]
MTIQGGRTVAIIGESAVERPKWSDGSEAFALQVLNNATVYLAGVRIETAITYGVEISQAQVWIQRSAVANNAGGAVSVAGGGSLQVENSFLGGDVNDVIAVDVTNGTVNILYTTIVAGFSGSAALRCGSGDGSSIRNSLLVSRSGDNEVDCPGIEVTTSALEMTFGDNVALGDMSTAWFVSEYNQGDFHLSANGYPAALESAGAWSAGDPSTDIDDEARPSREGAADFAGADRL